jgi:hypothetical protein
MCEAQSPEREDISSYLYRKDWTKYSTDKIPHLIFEALKDEGFNLEDPVLVHDAAVYQYKVIFFTYDDLLEAIETGNKEIVDTVYNACDDDCGITKLRDWKNVKYLLDLTLKQHNKSITENVLNIVKRNSNYYTQALDYVHEEDV